MKKPLTIAVSIVLATVIGIAITLVSSYLKDPSFKVVNQTKHVVFVSAYWRDKVREIGPIQPSSTYEFSVKDEAAMKFTGRYPDGREIDSEEIYFTEGTRVVATITESEIDVKYDHET